MNRSLVPINQSLAPAKRGGSIPIEKRPARGADKKLPQYIKYEEVQRMAEMAETQRDRMLILSLWNTGGRVEEVLNLRRCDFDPRGLSLRMLNEKQRRDDAEKMVFIGRPFALELLTYCEDNGIRGEAHLFPSRQSGRMSRTTAWRIVSKLGRKADVKAWPHLFRHGNAVHMLRNGVPITLVRDQLGHASILTTMVYTNLSDDERREFIGKVEF